MAIFLGTREAGKSLSGVMLTVILLTLMLVAVSDDRARDRRSVGRSDFAEPSPPSARIEHEVL
jgi:hypothetical protein